MVFHGQDDGLFFGLKYWLCHVYACHDAVKLDRSLCGWHLTPLCVQHMCVSCTAVSQARPHGSVNNNYGYVHSGVQMPATGTEISLRVHHRGSGCKEQVCDGPVEGVSVLCVACAHAVRGTCLELSYPGQTHAALGRQAAPSCVRARAVCVHVLRVCAGSERALCCVCTRGTRCARHAPARQAASVFLSRVSSPPMAFLIGPYAPVVAMSCNQPGGGRWPQRQPKKKDIYAD